METFLEFLREVLKGIVREISGYFFRRNILKHKKTTRQMNCTPIVRHIANNWGAVQRRSKQKGWFSQKNITDNHRPNG